MGSRSEAAGFARAPMKEADLLGHFVSETRIRSISSEEDGRAAMKRLDAGRSVRFRAHRIVCRRGVSTELGARARFEAPKC